MIRRETEATKIGEGACVALRPEFLQTIGEHVSLVGKQAHVSKVAIRKT